MKFKKIKYTGKEDIERTHNKTPALAQKIMKTFQSDESQNDKKNRQIKYFLFGVTSAIAGAGLPVTWFLKNEDEYHAREELIKFLRSEAELSSEIRNKIANLLDPKISPDIEPRIIEIKFRKRGIGKQGFVIDKESRSLVAKLINNEFEAKKIEHKDEKLPDKRLLELAIKTIQEISNLKKDYIRKIYNQALAEDPTLKPD